MRKSVFHERSFSAHDEIHAGGRNADFAVFRDGALPVARLAVDIDFPTAHPASGKSGEIAEIKTSRLPAAKLTTSTVPSAASVKFSILPEP